MDGWLDQGRRGLREGGGNCVKYLKRGWNRKDGKGNKDLKKGGQPGSKGGYLKKGEAGTPLRTMNNFWSVGTTQLPFEQTTSNLGEDKGIERCSISYHDLK